MTQEKTPDAMSADVRRDVERLRRVTRDVATDVHAHGERIDALEASLRRRGSGAAGAEVTSDTEITLSWLSEGGGAKDAGRGGNARREALTSDATRGTRARRTTRTTFDQGVVGGGEVEIVVSSARSEFLDQNDEQEARVVTLDRVKFSKTVLERDGTTVRARFVPLGSEGWDAIPGGVGGGGARRSHRLTGFGANGMNLIDRSSMDVMAAVSVERDNALALHAGVLTGNRQPEDGLGKFLAQLSAKSSTSTRHVNGALNLSRCQSGETIVGAALTFAKTLPKTTRAVVADAWAQVAVSQPNAREDLTEWGVAATLPPTTGEGAVKNTGWGVVLGKPANRGGMQAEAYLRVGSDGVDPGMTLLPGVIVSSDDRGRRDTTFACRAGWNW